MEGSGTSEDIQTVLRSATVIIEAVVVSLWEETAPRALAGRDVDLEDPPRQRRPNEVACRNSFG